MISRWNKSLLAAMLPGIALGCAALLHAAGAEAMLKPSLVAAWFDGPEDYKHYDVDLMVQDMDLVDEREIPRWKAFVERMHEQGKLVFAEMRPLTHLGKQQEYLMSDPGMQQAVCVDFNLNPIEIPWMLGRAYRGRPVYFYCSNHPRYRAYLRQQIYMYVAVGVDGIMVDDGGGAQFAFPYGGCFCEYCRARFRDYLAAKYTPAELAKLGVRDLQTFDYRNIVLRYADDRKSFRFAVAAGEIPLAEDYEEFLRRSDAELFHSLHDMADKLGGRHLPMGWDNVDLGGNYSLYYGTLDIFYSEINYQRFAPNGRGPDETLPGGIVLGNKLADALGMWFTPTPAPSSWTAIKTRNLTGLLQQWIALTYAHGGALRYPRKGWCFGETSRWYYPPKEEFEPLYAFVRKHRELFDGYEAAPQVGVLYTQNRQRIGNGYYRPLRHVVNALADANIPFALLIAGDEWLPNRLKSGEADRYELVVAPEPQRLVDGQQEIVEGWKREGRAVAVRAGEDVSALLAGRIEPYVSAARSADVWLVPRRNADNARAPVVCHLVNRRYDARENGVVPQRDLDVRLRKVLWNGAPVRTIRYYSIGRPPRELPFDLLEDGLRVRVPELALWGVLRIETQPGG